MANRFTEDFDGGLNTSSDRSDLQPGQVTQSSGGYYKPGDKRLHKMPGRSTFGTAEASEKILAVKLLQYDSGGTDRLAAYANQTLYSAPSPGTTGTFASLKGSLNASATHMSFAHYNDRWYCANGYDAMFAVENDGTVYTAGMTAPTQVMTAATSAAAAHSVTRAGAGSGTFDNEANAYDADGETFAGASLSSATSTTTTLTWASGTTGTSRKLSIDWAVAGFQQYTNPGGGGQNAGPIDDTGGEVDEGWSATVKMEISEDAGVTFTTFKNSAYTAPIARQTTQVDVADATNITTSLQVKITFTYNSGVSQATMRVYDVRVADGSTATDFSTTTGLYYAFSEVAYDQNDRSRESPVSESVLVTLSSENTVTLTLPSTTQNSSTTHFRIYRTTDGGSSPRDLGLIGEIQSSETTFFDEFIKYDKDTAAFPLVPLLKLSTARSDDSVGSALYFPINNPPPELIQVRNFQGSLVGLSRNNPRALYYSVPGRPEAWPPIYVITSFPFEEHDTLVDCIEVGDFLIIAAQDIMMRIAELPRIVQGTFAASEVKKIQGAPGCIGKKALTALSLDGDPHAAWIAPDGIYVTNGETYSSISDDHIDWYSAFTGITHSSVTISHDALDTQVKTDWGLHWVKHLRTLFFFFSSTSGGANDLYYTVRIPTGRGNDKQIRWSGPHPGNINSLTSGYVSSVFRMWSGHSSDGKVYTEWNGKTDTSNSYDSSSNWPLIVRSRRIYGEGNEWSALDGTLYHTDFGTSQTCTYSHTAGRDNPSEESTSSQTVALAGQRGTQYDVAYGGEWHEFSVAHTGQAKAGSALKDVQFEARGLGDRGTVKVA